jgi:hypothetical protein
MALSAPRLSLAIKTAFLARSWIANGPELTQFCDDLATAIITEITGNAVVPVPGTGLVAPVGGGPVTGAAVGSVT